MDALFIKICGVTSLDDALAAAESGADAIGFNFYSESKRFIHPARAAEIAGRLPENVLRVGVFVNSTRQDVNRAIRDGKINGIQFSGDEPPEAVRGYRLPVFKAIHVAGEKSLEEMKAFHVERFLLDTFSSDHFGGTGVSFDWSIARKAKQFGSIIMAGGLTAENVGDAVRKVKPYGVDVSSGVETMPGVKDHSKIREFIRRAREAETKS